jgi:hypothetical protein
MQNAQVQYTGHAGKGGLQGHSLGDDYPFCIIGVSVEGHHAEKHRYQARHLTSGWEGPIREKYMAARGDMALHALQLEIRDKCREDTAYRLGFIYYNAMSKGGNPYPMGSHDYGRFAQGFSDARRLQSAKEAADSNYTTPGMIADF